jgi:hypothetical protein
LLALVFFVATPAAGYLFYTGTLRIPARYNPWTPLDVNESPGPLTAYKLARARRSPELCQQALAQTGMGYDRLPDRARGNGCGFNNAVRLRAAGIGMGGPVTLSCPMALSFFMWERHALQPAAQLRFQQPVVAAEHLGSYSCRNINRGEGAAPASMAGASGSAGNRSQHATADALDLAGFILADGRRITVRRQWNDGGDAALFLKDIHGGACRFFDGVLGPDYNAVHADHFHLETGGYGMCR